MAVAAPTLTVFIVTWNGRQWLPRCLDSLQRQTHPKLEVIVVDNGSDDGSVTYLRGAYPEVRVLAQTRNLGFAAANAAGIATAHGELILLLNTDAWLEHDAVEALVAERVQRGLDVIGPIEVGYSADAPVRPRRTQIDVCGHPVNRAGDRRASFYLSGVCLLFPRELYHRTGGLDPDYFMYFEEADWFWRLNLQGAQFAYSEDVVVHHAGAGSSGEGLDVQRFRWRNENVLRMLLTNYAASTLLWVLPLHLLQTIFEAVVFVAIGRREIAATYPAGWAANVRALRGTLAKRRAVQARRRVCDREIRARMYRGPGKLHHLLTWRQLRQAG